LSGKRLKGFGEAAAMPLHVVLDRVMADHPDRSRGGFRCAIIWRAKPARTTGTCAPPFRRDRAMASAAASASTSGIGSGSLTYGRDGSETVHRRRRPSRHHGRSACSNSARSCAISRSICWASACRLAMRAHAPDRSLAPCDRRQSRTVKSRMITTPNITAPNPASGGR
jgi:hypothetical protein